MIHTAASSVLTPTLVTVIGNDSPNAKFIAPRDPKTISIRTVRFKAIVVIKLNIFVPPLLLCFTHFLLCFFCELLT